MSRFRFVTFVVLLAVMVSFAIAPRTAVVQAANEEWIIKGRLASGCFSGDTGFSVQFKNLTPGATYYADTIVRDANGVVYMDEYFSSTAPGPFDNDWYVFDSNDRGLQTGSFPLPAGKTLTIIMTLRDASEKVLSTASAEFICDGGGFKILGLPGCDVSIPIPSQAVVGEFVTDTPLYWKPGELTNPLVTIPAGKTAWVFGTDASGEYYEVLWVCDIVYVPRGAMGPNFDEVWNGRPLPTTNAQ